MTGPRDEINLGAKRALLAAKRVRAGMLARTGLLDFARLMKPSSEFPDDPDHSRYQIGRHHSLLARKLEEVESGKCRRLIVTMPPRHGKSELSTRLFPSWFMGKRPERQVIVGAYNEEKARDFGRDVLRVVGDPAFKQVFPEFALDPGAKAAGNLRTTAGGVMLFSGVGGASTGYGADLLVIDDPIKNREDADSFVMREKVWGWFTDTALTRIMPGGAIIIVLTRWHENDLAGRIKDPAYLPDDLARNWQIINLPAIAEADDPLERTPGEALWPEWYDETALDEIKRTMGSSFTALYQQRPAPEEGSYFKKEMLRTYTPDQLPKNLRVYGVSDHALSEDIKRDASCAGVFGIDTDGKIYILDVFWDRVGTDALAENILRLMSKWRVMEWFPANDNVFKSFRPFLELKMRESGVWCFLNPIQEVKSKEARAQSIRGRMSQGYVLFPAGAPWLHDAYSEILSFPQAAHDDFVDMLSLIGLSMDDHITPARQQIQKPEPVPGSIQWMVKQHAAERRAREATGASEWIM